MLFSESPSRIIVSFPASSRAAIENIAEREKCPFTVIGHVGGNKLRIKLGEEETISAEVSAMENVWCSSLSKKLEAEVMAAARE
jgi:phosphoribosylformylglycinamidine (FGAM) synthase-like enzyme